VDVSSDGTRDVGYHEWTSQNRRRGKTGTKGELNFPLVYSQLIKQDLVLSTSSDPFYAQNIFSNFGDLGAALATYVSDYQSKNTKIGPTSTNRIETVADMKRFVEEYPEFRRLGGNVTKHVTLVGELSRLVERDDMLSVSEVEQSLASQESHQADLKVSLRF
jgi:vacuolar protein sorting-associated protein 45